jgi:2-polyprenyl-3-methyl-5-hydroxy-6-metoxy-1,4-benzoquinol methylase
VKGWAGPDLPPGFNAAAPEIKTVTIDSCPVCDTATNRLIAAEGYDYEIQTCRNLWLLWRCAECDTLWLNPRPADKELGTIYPPSYYAYEMSDQLSPFILKGKAWLDRGKFNGILKHLGRAPRSYLDVGCGDGRYLRQLAELGVARDKIIGIELSSPAIPKLRRAGFQIYSERVEDCDAIEPRSLDLITMFHVIEHVADPIRVMKQLAHWLTPGGVLAIETPNTASIDRRLFSKTWWGGYHIPRHWTLFTDNSLRKALAKAELEPLKTQYQTGHSFWLYSFHHWLKYNRRRQLPALAHRFDPMRSRLPLMFFTGFDIARRMIGMRTSAMLVVAKKLDESAA